MPATLAILDGDVMDVAHAQIPVTEDGLLRGDGVFEVARINSGRRVTAQDDLAAAGEASLASSLPQAPGPVSTAAAAAVREHIEASLARSPAA